MNDAPVNDCQVGSVFYEDGFFFNIYIFFFFDFIFFNNKYTGILGIVLIWKNMLHKNVIKVVDCP